ncbi:MAG: 3-methyl-2-oxobutanoate hydroxymethyltransferase [Dehalococcoidales bacterium]|nr:3-methyl-2-oxobutanoate hydroxymethyltransferase [Dehalococcoidia bacterium]NCG34823.1 3-methyl-2-oxobutanoate hydroxymethyltransferase [Dehalococcoidales bacterium]
MKKKLSTEEILKLKSTDNKLSMVTAYDFVSGYIVNNSKADMILVGDSYGTTSLGYKLTNQVEITDIIRATKSISNNRINTLLISDLPYKTYETKSQALENAKKLIDCGADAVKLEGGVEKKEIITFLVDNNIKVMGHIGIKPQNITKFEQYKILGKNKNEYKGIMEDAITVEKSGVFALVLELIQSELSHEITKKLNIPTIGIGSGEFTDGQVQVFNDLIGYSPFKLPKHAKKYSDVFKIATESINNFIREVK